ncbi:thiol:disulfide interchange protein DsbA/DsbL [Rhodoferax sp.]|uniref:thiol:disulfide interchange protein DsbA/DsbL n=1 Tax=Rhodoferax sp. TaxID=50421 RepID=UPI00283B74F1|nr:thiol:disulfide interchange protein DsbA/DsbL [Rhodoferax sp.]MDR3371951.1 thiol:disulfide interchange protein DsbA/DsbL [Rhodoferax sp.]
MNRRDFAIGIALTPLSATWVHATVQLEAGTDYQALQTPLPVSVPGKIEVIEFFGYWCPHCNAFEPRLEPWAKALPKDVVFRRIPVAWQEGQVPYQRLFYALEAMGVSNDIHSKVFKAIHEQHLRLDSDANMATFAAAIGVDKTKLVDAMKGFSVDAWMRTANQLAKSYQIEGVPTLAVNGMYVTSPEMAKGEVQSLNVVDALIKKARTRR